MSENRLRLKQAWGWFAASDGFRAAMELLSDGAFRLFVHLCLEADRKTGRILTSYSELARQIGRSRRVIIGYVRELDQKGVCIVRAGRNQHTRTLIELSDNYWPYVKPNERADVGYPGAVEEPSLFANGRDSSPTGEKSNNYVESIRRWYLEPLCTSNQFSSRDRAKAVEFQERGISLEFIEAALLLGTARKYISWLNGATRTPIGSLEYFEPLVSEVHDQTVSASYRKYLRVRTKQLAQLCMVSGTGTNGSSRKRNPTLPNIGGDTIPS